MQSVLNLRVTSPFLAMRESNRSPAFITVPKGAFVETSYQLDQPGLVRIMLANQPLFAFMRDLRERAEPLDGLGWSIRFIERPGVGGCLLGRLQAGNATVFVDSERRYSITGQDDNKAIIIP